MRVRLSEAADAAGIAAISAGFGVRFGWWLATIVAGVLVIIANALRSR